MSLSLLGKIEGAGSRLLEAALTDAPQVFPRAADLVKLIKTLCVGVPDEAQQDTKARIAEVVGYAKAVAGAVTPAERIQQLADLNKATNALIVTIRVLCETIVAKDDHAMKRLSTLRMSEEERCPVESGDESDDAREDGARAPTSPPAAAPARGLGSPPPVPTTRPAAPSRPAQGPNTGAAQPQRPARPAQAAVAAAGPSSHGAEYDRFVGELHDMREAILDWQVAEYITKTTGLVRRMPSYLQQADAKAASNPGIKPVRQSVVQSCTTLTNFARHMARNQGQRAVAPQIVDGITLAEHNLRQFAEELCREETPSGGSILVNFQKLQQLVRRHEHARPTGEPAQDVGELQAIYGNVKSSLSALLTALDRPSEKAIRSQIEIAVIVTCRLLEVADCISTNLPMRDQCFRFLNALLQASSPFHEPASKPSHTEDIATSAQTVRTSTRALSKGIDTLCTLCLKRLANPDADGDPEPVMLPSSVGGGLFTESPGSSRQQSVEVLPAEEQLQEAIIHVCSGSAFDTKNEREIEKGELIVFQGLDPEADIDTVKAMISNQTDIPFLKQEIVHANAVLPNSKRLKDLTMSKEAPLYLFDIRESGSQRALFGQEDDITLDGPDSRRSFGAAGDDRRGSKAHRLSAGNGSKKKFELQRSDLKMGEDERVRLMQLVKEGKLSVEDVMSGLKGEMSASATLAVEASKVRSGSVDQPAGYINVVNQARARRSKPVDERNMLLKEGVLTKEGYNRKNWKKRWFVLRPGRLTYYKSPDDKGPLGVIELSKCGSCVQHQCEKGRHVFSILPPEGVSNRTYFLAADSMQDMKQWIELIDSQIPGRRSLGSKHAVVQDLIGHLIQRGAQKEGIFRVPGNAGQVKKLMRLFETTEDLRLDQVLNPHTLAGFLKKILLEEKIDPLVPNSAQCLLDRAFEEDESEQDQLTALDSTLSLVTEREGVVLQALLRLFALVCQNQQSTKMSSDQVAPIFGRLMFKSMGEARSAIALEYMIDRAVAELET